jgi:hypothetical protein
MKFEKILILYLVSFLTLAGLSLRLVPGILAGNCFFQTSWFSCNTALSSPQKIAVTALIIAVVAIFGLVSWSIWNALAVGTTMSLKKIQALFVVLALSSLVMIPFGSSDLSYYFEAGRALANGYNVYTDTWPMQKVFVYPIPTNDIIGFSYGPIIALAFESLYRLSGESIVWFIVLWKSIMFASLVALSFLVRALVRVIVRQEMSLVSTLLFASQPIFLFEWVVNGHFDVLWLLCVLVAALFAHKKQWWLVIPALVVGIWIKFIPLLLTPIFVIWWLQSWSKDTWKQQLTSTSAGLVLGAGVTIFSWMPYWHGPQVFVSVAIQSKWAVISIFATLYYSLKPLFVWLFQDGAHWYLTRAVQGFLLAFFTFTLWPYLSKVWNVVRRNDFWLSENYLQLIFIFLLSYLMLWQKSFLPWYAAWFLPFGLLLFTIKRSDTAWRIARWLSFTPFAYYMLWLVDWHLTRTDAGSELWFYASIVGIVMVYPLTLLYRWRAKQFE